MKILIVEDESSLRQSMSEFLTEGGYVCESAADYLSALEKMESFEYDCIILDIMLPGGSGLDLLKHLQADRKKDGVIIISARDALEDRIAGLQTGADDYLVKPFHLSELSARVAAIIRRRQQEGKALVMAGGLILDTDARIARVNDQKLELTNKEFQLLLFLVINRNRVLSKNAIARHLWSDSLDMAGNYDFIYTHVKNIRKKIIAAGGQDCIRSVYGAGYKLTAD